MSTTVKEKCPAWCVCSREEGAHEHHSEPVTRNGFRMELVRFDGDTITHVTLMTGAEYGPFLTMPVETMVDLMNEARLKVAVTVPAETR